MMTLRHTALLRTVAGLTAVGLLLGWAVPAAAVAIASPQAGATVRGTVQVLAAPTAAEQYHYAILAVDAERRSVTNAQPLRFELDTTKLANGEHVLQVDLADLAGILSSSAPVKITVANPRAAALPADLPAPAPSTYTGRFSNLPRPVKHAIRPVVPPPAAPAPPAAVPVQAPAATEVNTLPQPRQSFTVTSVLHHGRALVPLRALVDALGGTLTWDNAKKRAIALIDSRTYLFTAGADAVLVDGVGLVISRPVVLLANQTMLPLSAWGEVFGGSAIQHDAAGTRLTVFRRSSTPEQVAAQP